MSDGVIARIPEFKIDKKLTTCGGVFQLHIISLVPMGEGGGHDLKDSKKGNRKAGRGK